jgi:hypothetical protein
LQGKRRIRELRQEPLPEGTQSLVSLEGGSVLAAPKLLANASDVMENLLRLGTFPPGAKNHLEERMIALPNGGRAFFVRRRVHRPRGWLWAWLRGKPLLSPERQQADAIYRLQRHGVAVPCLLAYGQRQPLPWRQESLLLVEAAGRHTPLLDWLSRCPNPQARRWMVTEAALLLRRMHAAGIYLGTDETLGFSLQVWHAKENGPRLVLGSVATLVIRRRPCERLAAQDLEVFRRAVDLLKVREESRCAASGGANSAERGTIDEESGTRPADGILSEVILSVNHGAEA